jgi:osmotically-inducible protein OsmY
MSLVQGSKVLPISRTLVACPLKETARAEAETRLRHSPYRELRRVSCELHDGVLMLRGRVSCYYLKQMAQHLVCRLEGVAEIDNRLDVNRIPVAKPSGG